MRYGSVVGVEQVLGARGLIGSFGVHAQLHLVPACVLEHNQLNNLCDSSSSAVMCCLVLSDLLA